MTKALMNRRLRPIALGLDQDWSNLVVSECGWGECGELCCVNLARRFEGPAADRPPVGRAALVVDDDTITYGELWERVATWRGALIAAGLEPGDRVALLAGNSAVFPLGYLACLGAGLVTVPLNPASPVPELTSELDMVTPAAIIVDEGCEPVWAGLAPTKSAAGLERFDVTRLDGGGPGGAPADIVDVDDDAIAALLFTSGTAGPPRPAILTHGNFASSLQSIVSLPLGLLEDHHTALAVIPLFHVFGLNVIVNLGVFIGATLVLEDHVAPNRTCELARANGVTIVAGPPTLWRSLLLDNSIEPDSFATVRLAVSGAAKLDPRVSLGLAERLNVDVREGYGLTETCGIAATAMGSSAPRGSVGPLFPGVEARLVDADENDVLVGDAGELWLRGPMVSPGYFGDEETTRRTRTADGWLRTGDVAMVDENGHLAIIDRLKDLIIVSGFNVHPTEVESALTGHPAIAAAAVVGEPDEATGERIVAHVVPADPAIDPEELRRLCIEHCSASLARYKVPRRVVVASELPVTAIGKIRRRELGGPAA